MKIINSGMMLPLNICFVIYLARRNAKTLIFTDNPLEPKDSPLLPFVAVQAMMAGRSRSSTGE
jgi:hypothetical protein